MKWGLDHMTNREKQFENYLNIIFGLEWLGIRMEETKEERDSGWFSAKTSYYFSVPELSTIEIENQELNTRIKTFDGLKAVAKEVLTDMMIDACEQEYGDDKGFIEDVKKDTSNYFKFYAKVRKDEVWTKELGDKRIKELIEEIQKASGYKEI